MLVGFDASCDCSGGGGYIGFRTYQDLLEHFRGRPPEAWEEFSKELREEAIA